MSILQILDNERKLCVDSSLFENSDYTVSEVDMFVKECQNED
jgi:hypothetical protein